MRSLMIVPLCLLVAACSEGEAPKAEVAIADNLEPGLWEATSEVTAFRSTDKSTPAVQAAVGDKSTVQACVTEADKATPPVSLFAGEGYDCKYATDYLRGGRINHSLECTRKDVTGSIPMQVEGTYRGDAFEGNVTTQTYLPGTGDFAMTRKITARRTAPSCPPDLDAPADKAKA